MTNVFTHLSLRFDFADFNISNVQLRGNEHELQSGPSESVIKNLLNYSKALSVIPDKGSDKVHLILLN